jgi:gamma-glutamyltranspeptidase
MNAIAKWHMDEISKYEEDFCIGKTPNPLPYMLQWHIQQIERITQWVMNVQEATFNNDITFQEFLDTYKKTEEKLQDIQAKRAERKDALENLEEQHRDGAISWNKFLDEEERLAKEFIKAKEQEQDNA